MTRLGVAFVPTTPPEALPALARAADEHLDDLWVWEDCFKHAGIASAAVALAHTTRVRVGIGLLPTPLRAVAATAMEIATLARIFPGRLVPGIGHGVQEWMEQAGVRVDSPLTLLEEQLVTLRSLLAGEEVSVDGRYVRLDRVRLDWPPDPVPPLMSGGHGPRTLELAGRLADGVLLAGGLDLEAVESSIAAALGARDALEQDPEVVTSILVATGDDAEERVRADLAAVDNEPAPGRAVTGSAAEIADGIRQHARLGATTVVVVPTADEPDVAGLVELLGREVRPLLG